MDDKTTRTTAPPVVLYEPQPVPPPGAAGRVLGGVLGAVLILLPLMPLARWPDYRGWSSYSRYPVEYRTVWTWTPLVDGTLRGRSDVWPLVLCTAMTALPVVFGVMSLAGAFLRETGRGINHMMAGVFLVLLPLLYVLPYGSWGSLTSRWLGGSVEAASAPAGWSRRSWR
jgi:hypothetical protein